VNLKPKDVRLKVKTAGCSIGMNSLSEIHQKREGEEKRYYNENADVKVMEFMSRATRGRRWGESHTG